jgi:hypothetical protein
MHAEAVNPATGERIAFEISVEELDRLVRAARPRVSKKKLERMIGNLELPSQVKVLLDSSMSATVKIGNAVVYIGRRVLEIVFDLCQRYPSFTFAVVVCLVGQLLLMAAPWLTPILAPLLTAIQLLYAWVTDWLRQRTNQNASKGEQGNEEDGNLKSYMRLLSDEPVGREAQEAIQPFSVLNAGA